MIKISGGQARGRNILVPPGMKTRPTSSQVREAVFGMLQQRISDALVLDLFCGSGAYGLEAISRGASHVVLVDNDHVAVQTVRQNMKSLGFDKCAEIYESDFARALQIFLRNDKKFDIIFIDPPYEAGYYQTAIGAILKLLSESGCIVCEHPISMTLTEPDGLCIDRNKRYGKRAITILTRRNDLDRNLSGEL